MKPTDIQLDEKTIITINCNHLSQEELDTFTSRMKASNKQSKIAGSFTSISELQLHHLKHFLAAPYFWKPLQGNIWGGMLADETIDYIHLVLATKEIVEFLLDKESVKKQIDQL